MTIPVEDLPCYNGVQNGTGYCVCNEGWTATGDLYFAEGHACFVNIALLMGVDLLAVCVNMFLYYHVWCALQEGNWTTCCRVERATDSHYPKYNAVKAITFLHIARLPFLLATATTRLSGIPLYTGKSTFITLCSATLAISFHIVVMCIFVEQFFRFYSIAERLQARIPVLKKGVRSPVVVLWSFRQAIMFCAGYSVLALFNVFGVLYIKFADDVHLGMNICYIGVAALNVYGLGVLCFIRHMCDATLCAHTHS
jgi:hypothetical protein